MTFYVTDEFTFYMIGAAPDTGSALEWLDAQFTGRWASGAFQFADEVPGPEDLRPMIELIDQDTDATDPDLAMTTRPADYHDPLRWWL